MRHHIISYHMSYIVRSQNPHLSTVFSSHSSAGYTTAYNKRC